MMVGLFISIVAIFAAYCIGSNIGYADCIKHEESKKKVVSNIADSLSMNASEQSVAINN